MTEIPTGSPIVALELELRKVRRYRQEKVRARDELRNRIAEEITEISFCDGEIPRLEEAIAMLRAAHPEWIEREEMPESKPAPDYAALVAEVSRAPVA